MGRVVALVEVLTTRLGIRPNRDTWSLLVEGFLETRRTQTEVALEAFFHAHQEGEGTYQRATTLLVERLLIEERVEEASKVVEMHERAIKKEAIGGTRFAAGESSSFDFPSPFVLRALSLFPVHQPNTPSSKLSKLGRPFYR